MAPFECVALVALIGPRTKETAEFVKKSVLGRQSEKIPGRAEEKVGFKRGR